MKTLSRLGFGLKLIGAAVATIILAVCCNIVAHALQGHGLGQQTDGQPTNVYQTTQGGDTYWFSNNDVAAVNIQDSFNVDFGGVNMSLDIDTQNCRTNANTGSAPLNCSQEREKSGWIVPALGIDDR